MTLRSNQHTQCAFPTRYFHPQSSVIKSEIRKAIIKHFFYLFILQNNTILSHEVE